MKSLLSTALLSVFVTSSALAQVSVHEPWVRATVPAQTATGAFMHLHAMNAARLVEASSPAAGVVEIHEMTVVDKVMKMRAIPGLDVPAGKAVELKPGGYHLMLQNLKGQIKAGDIVPLKLVFEGADKKRSVIDIKASARALNAAMPGKQ